MDYRIIIYIFFGLLPSLIWLTYYLKKDLHPEPKRMILKIFIWGALITVPVFFVQIGTAYVLDKIPLPPLAQTLIHWFIVIAFVEELFKYLIVKIKFADSSNMDEPLDIVLYMVVGALGFAALENTLYLIAPATPMSFGELMDRTLLITAIRFVGATFLHTLASAIIGYFMAISFLKARRKYETVMLGILIATLLHGFYNFSIMTLEGVERFMVPAILIVLMAFAVFWGFERIKKIKSVCLVEPEPSTPAPEVTVARKITIKSSAD